MLKRWGVVVAGEKGLGDNLFSNLEVCGVCIKVQLQFLQIRFQSIIAAQI